MTLGHWGLKPVFRCSKPHTFSTFSGEEKKRKIVHSFLFFSFFSFSFQSKKVYFIKTYIQFRDDPPHHFSQFLLI